jgi:hypothetical protein
MSIDLHVHTNYSDSTLSPLQVIDYAESLGLRAIGVTDHDTVDGLEETMKAAEGREVKIISGVELSAETEEGEVHILGYFGNWFDKRFKMRLDSFREKRAKRARHIVEKLIKLGINVDYQLVLKQAGPGNIGRLHIAHVLLNIGAVKTIKEAFQRFIGYGKPAYVRKFKLSPVEAIKIILEVGGVPVLAHPYYNKCEKLIPELVAAGLRGLEVYHPEHTKEQERHFRYLAEKFGLLITGGSDCHGTGKGSILIGTVRMPDKLIDELEEEKEEIERASTPSPIQCVSSPSHHPQKDNQS